MRAQAALTLLGAGLAVLACEAPTAPVRLNATFALVTYNGAPLPQFVPSLADELLGYESTWLADTIVVNPDGLGIKRAVWQRLLLADSSESLLPTFATFSYVVRSDSLVVTWIACGDGCTFSSPTATMLLTEQGSVLNAASGSAVYHRLPATLSR